MDCELDTQKHFYIHLKQNVLSSFQSSEIDTIIVNKL